MRRRSLKRQEMAYGEWVAMRLERWYACEVIAPGCHRKAEGMHHLRKRSAGGRIKSRLNTLRSCNHCNGYIEDHPRWARAQGLVIREGDPWWPWLGVRLPSGRRL